MPKLLQITVPARDTTPTLSDLRKVVFTSAAGAGNTKEGIVANFRLGDNIDAATVLQNVIDAYPNVITKLTHEGTGETVAL